MTLQQQQDDSGSRQRGHAERFRGNILSVFYLHDLGVDLVQLGAFVPLPAELLVPGVLLPERVQQLHHLRLSQQLLLHGTPGWTWGSEVSGWTPRIIITNRLFAGFTVLVESCYDFFLSIQTQISTIKGGENTQNL